MRTYVRSFWPRKPTTLLPLVEKWAIVFDPWPLIKEVIAGHTATVATRTTTAEIPKPGHIKESTRANNMGGSQKGKPE
jgi:hypothetical protein